jgi:hypothetical protein
MSDGTGATNPHTEDSFAESKGKGKAAQEDVPHGTAMDEDDDEDEDDEDEDELEEEVSLWTIQFHSMRVCNVR